MGLRSYAEFDVNGLQLPVAGHLQRQSALVEHHDGGHCSSFAKGANDCWPRAQIGNNGVRVLIRTGLLVGNLPHSRFREVQLEGPSGGDLQVPGEGPVEGWEQRGLGLNDVSRAGVVFAFWDSWRGACEAISCFTKQLHL